ncbi:hypothetical protein J8I87_25640 [Paraburkholderia sp. LEh10]|uniref:hypothetical protein n=1 Tax=Paraburkholderia sp. LEh10 TaxID=2821353 RepID=UPI001AE6FB82|nr:hypothetical protein [Paraburkholderia sp. LEh10]MBP0593040.1 hypothetical protein [Paraburkholderia sp. LEh10]
MTAFLLIWSPRKWPWPELPDVAKRVAAGEAVTDVWGCGFSRSILPGDRVFIHRVTLEPKGVFASGYVTRAPYEVPDATKKRGYRLCVDFVYDYLADAHHEVVISRDELRKHPFSVQTWDAQTSGISIKPIAEGALEKLWIERTGRRARPVVAPQTGEPAKSTKEKATQAWSAANKAAAGKRAARVAMYFGPARRAGGTPGDGNGGGDGNDGGNPGGDA